AENVTLKENVKILEAGNAELVDKISELTVHNITQNLHTTKPNDSADIGQTSMVQKLKTKERKIKRYEDYEYSNKKRDKGHIENSHSIITLADEAEKISATKEKEKHDKEIAT
ncbi:unnamed protein product, partial [Ilex paraguariensis]